jgi:Glycerophosphoryl diester phosphodiesterase family
MLKAAMTPRDDPLARLLSHRLRGFDQWESTRLGLERALLTGVRNVEFDVRVTRDGHPIAYHDPFFKADDGAWCFVDDWDLAALRSQQAMRHLATLEEMCDCFATFRSPHALFHVDVKVVGHEAVIHDTIAKFGLLPHTVLVSWLPSALLRFHALSPQTRLCFSHLPMTRPPWLYAVAKALSPIVQDAAPVISRGLRGIAPQLANETLTVRLHFHDDGDPAHGDSGDDETHLTPGHVVPGLLKGTMLDALRNTEGMVCVPLRLATRALARGYQSQNIQFAVYSVNDQPTLESAVANIDPDIIYVDNADIIRRAATSPALGTQVQSDRQPQPLTRRNN